MWTHHIIIRPLLTVHCLYTSNISIQLQTMVHKMSLQPPAMDWEATDPLQTFQEFRAMDELWPEDQNMPKKAHYKIVSLVECNGMETWKSFSWEDENSMDKSILAKVFNKLKAVSKTSNTMNVLQRRLQP